MFTPQREHARFCSASCRVTWNGQHADDLPLLADTLDWSIAAMWQATERLARVPGCDPADGFAIVAEAVWWVTMVDATVVRYHADAYTGVLDGLSLSEREMTEDTFGGLRFVRNRMAYDGLSSLVLPVPPRDTVVAAGGEAAGVTGAGETAGTVGSWTWASVPEPAMPALSRRGREWEMSRYHSYQAQLAGRQVGQAFDRATAFLRLACQPSELRHS